VTCREYGISRQTGHKWLERFQELGYPGLEEERRRPEDSPLATGEEIVAAAGLFPSAPSSRSRSKVALMFRFTSTSTI
jgi:putative transposase